MSKLSKDELRQKINELIEDKDKSIELLEDIEDSFENKDNSELDDLKTKYSDLETKYSSLQDSYKARFLEGSGKPVEPTVPELEEKQIVDIKEI